MKISINLKLIYKFVKVVYEKTTYE